MYSKFLLLVFFLLFLTILISFFYSPYPFSSCFETFSGELTFLDWLRTGQRWEWRRPVIGQGREFLLTHPWCHRQRRGRWWGCSRGVPTESMSILFTWYYTINMLYTLRMNCVSPPFALINFILNIMFSIKADKALFNLNIRKPRSLSRSSDSLN